VVAEIDERSRGAFRICSEDMRDANE